MAGFGVLQGANRSLHCGVTERGQVLTRSAGAGGGFAVVDVETTGLYPSKDRVVEIAVVQVDLSGFTTGEFATLINPSRDVGPTRIHGISAADVIDAPLFGDVAAQVWTWLTGRVLVAHNANFDARFLDAEFSRCGVRFPPPPLMCTMQLATQYLAGLPSRSLAACCEAAKVELSNHHCAIDDARAAAGLLASYRAAHHRLPASWAQAIAEAGTAAWVPAPIDGHFRVLNRGEPAARRAAQRPPLADLVDRLPRGAGGDLDSYLHVLDRVLEDRVVTGAEAGELVALAAELGLASDTARDAHRQYLRHVATAAWLDGVVTDVERADLLEVAQLLAVPADEALAILAAAHQVTAVAPAVLGLSEGDRVVFTGDMHLTRSEIEAMAIAAGLRVTSSVSRKTALVVEADPYSQSAKASAAKDLGIRVVTEQVFLYMLDGMAGGTREPTVAATSPVETAPQLRSDSDVAPSASAPRVEPVAEALAAEISPPAVSAAVPAGWYPDAAVSGSERWWDGNGWGSQTRPSSRPVAAWYPDPQGLPCWRWWDGTAWTAHTR